MKKTLSIFLLLTFLFCSIASIAQSPAPGPITTVEFGEMEFDFGEAEAGEIVKHTFVVKNTGDELLVITNAKGSCGCTVPHYSKEPIRPGETGVFHVEFNTKNKKGKQAKRITITANTDPAQTFLTIKGTVNPAEKNEPIVQEKLRAIGKPSVKEEDLTLYPNPTQETLFLSVEGFEGRAATVDIMDAQGKLLQSKTFGSIQMETPIQLDVQHYTPGTYTATIWVADSKPVSKTFVVSK